MTLTEFVALKLAVWMRALPIVAGVTIVASGFGGVPGQVAAAVLMAGGAWLLWRFWSGYGG